jgi:8-oxo-dGTP diphosphatase
MYPPTPLVGVAVLVERHGAVLLVKRACPPNAGRWSLPGGHVELGEPLKEAARREVAEECGIDVEVQELLDAHEHIERDNCGAVRFHFVLVIFSGQYGGRTLRPASDAAAAAWVPLAELPRYEVTEMVRSLLDKVVARNGKPAPCPPDK